MQRGFTYLWVLIAIAITSAGLASVTSIYSQAVARSKRMDSLWVQEQYASAIQSYQSSTPIGTSAFPATLEELLDDKRYVTVRRHIRELYVDPLSGQMDWQLLIRPDGRIVGIQSRQSLSLAPL
jgi:type II secretory pathway pseudopilin PulG